MNDILRIVEHITTGGSAEYPVAALPDGLKAWRRRLRAEARRVGIRVSVRSLAADLVTVFDPDYEPARDEWRAIADVLAADLAGRQLTYDDALHARRRARLHVVRGE